MPNWGRTLVSASMLWSTISPTIFQAYLYGPRGPLSRRLATTFSAPAQENILAGSEKKSEPTKIFFRAGQIFSPSRTNFFIRADQIFYLGRPKFFESGVRRASDGQLHVPAIGPWHLNSFVFPMEIVIRVPGFASL